MYGASRGHPPCDVVEVVRSCLANVVRIQLRGAAGLERAQTTVIPRGESCRDIDGFSRVSCNAELGGRAVEPAMPGATCWRAGPRKPATAAELNPRDLWRSLPEAGSEPDPPLRCA